MNLNSSERFKTRRINQGLKVLQWKYLKAITQALRNRKQTNERNSLRFVIS